MLPKVITGIVLVAVGILAFGIMTGKKGPSTFLTDSPASQTSDIIVTPGWHSFSILRNVLRNKLHNSKFVDN